MSKKSFFTADWHIDHAKAIVYDERPFTDVDHMHRVLINNYNSTVPEDGLCYFLGDIGFSNKEVTKSIITQLNGTKVCVLGNHDKNASAMYDVGFDVVLHGAVIYIANKRVTLSHCPLMGVFREDTTHMRGGGNGDNWHGESKHRRYSFTDEGQYHLHGHIHTGPVCPDKPLRTNRQFDVGVPGNQYRPVSISTVESWIVQQDLKEQAENSEGK